MTKKFIERNGIVYERYGIYDCQGVDEYLDNSDAYALSENIALAIENGRRYRQIRRKNGIVLYLEKR